MKNTQVIQLMSIVRLSIFMLGITMMSCNSKKGQQLPAIGKSVAWWNSKPVYSQWFRTSHV